MNAQLPLALRWPAQQRFASYVAGDNALALELLREAAESAPAPWVFVAGPRGSGRTHLLLAACAAATDAGRSAQYLPLKAWMESAASSKRIDADVSLRALGGSDLLALDDVDALARDAQAEHALFDLYNRCKVEKSTMLFAAAAAPTQCGFALPDLVSRLGACAQAPLKPLGEADRRDALRQRALARGLALDDAVLDWLFTRAQRDLGSLTALLERMDRESLASQRRITVPFLRKLLDEGPG